MKKSLKKIKPRKAQGPRVSWERRLEQLREFKKEFGHCRVPQGWARNPKLNIWVNEQRRAYRLKQEGRYSSLDDEKHKTLDEIGFEFTVISRKKGEPASSNASSSSQEAAGNRDENESSDSDEYDGTVEQVEPAYYC